VFLFLEFGNAQSAIVEFFGPFSLHHDLTAGADDVSWRLRRAKLFGIPILTAMAPRVTAREWISAAGEYEMSANVTMPLLGHLLHCTGKLPRAPARTQSRWRSRA